MSSRSPPDRGLLVLDGGLATELERRGHDVSGPLWSARLLQAAPEAIEQLHYDYYAAGADCAITASYQASYEGFAREDVSAEETTRLLRLAVALASSARRRYRADHPEDPRSLLVAASVGPYGAISHDGAEYRGDYGLDVNELVDFHARRFDVLATAGADLLACETIPLLDEARALAILLARYPDQRAWLSFSSQDGVRTAHGEPLRDCGALAEGVPNVVAVGVNCVRPEIVGDAIRSLREGSAKPIVVYPNTGESWDAGDENWRGRPSDQGPGELAREWAGAGAGLIGGCCRVGPAAIASIRDALRAKRP